MIDASAAVAWSLPSQRTASAMIFVQRVAGQFTAPWYFGVEFRNAMLRAEKRRLIPREAAESAVSDTMQLVALAAPPSAASLDAIQRLARREGLTHYDGHYLDLALASGSPLATRDKALIEACKRLRIEVHDLRDEING